jgi:hypothetical protein
LRAADLDFSLGLGMGSSEVLRRHPPHHLSPAPANHQAGPDPEARLERDEVRLIRFGIPKSG